MRPIVLFTIFLMILFTSCKQNIDYTVSDPSYSVNNGPLRNYRGDTRDSIFKADINVSIQKRNISERLGVKINAFGSFDVYWDNVLIGANGKMAKPGRTEVYGTETKCYQVPEELSKNGKHTVTLIGTQSEMRDEDRGIDVKLGCYERLIREPLIAMSFVNIMAGAFLIASIYYFFLFINSSRKEIALLLFGIICFFFFSLLILEYSKYYIDIPYTQFYIRLKLIGWLTFVISILIPWCFMLQFEFKKKRFLLLPFLTILIAIYIINYGHYDFTAVLFSYTMWFASMIIAIIAVVRKIKSGWIVLSGLVLSAVVSRFVFYDFGLFITFTIIILCMLYIHTIKAKAIEDAHHASLLLSSRLQLELLKKNIQPHFLRNTLTSLIDWIEESPKQGVVFLRALAEEFDIMNDISEETLIPIRQEIELCRKHLEIMSFRKEVCYNWEEKDIDEHDTIPPAIIHTILENGITHSKPPKEGCINFCLSYAKKDNYKQYELLTVAENRKAMKKSKGTGFKYIKARLNESYGDHWEFDSYATEQGWLTTIKIFERK
ncbi:histidine kinase [Flavobacterium sp. HTF]|uniref:histidine kinase n=1 Tax=Flavobacterium sp. HTF TaxID=2170732 RepID=UPI001FB047F9|nr:histidine kinase [Flavobacterium sp. HTF]